MSEPLELDDALWKIRVLVVENDADMRRAYEESLTEWGYDPVLVHGKGAALMDAARTCAREAIFQVAQVDMRLGDDRDPDDMRGLELIPDLRPAVCIVLTGYSSIQTTRQALVGQGAFDYIGKQNAPEMRARIADAASVACLCDQSGAPHWHPAAAHTLNAGALTRAPARQQSFATFYQAADSVHVLRVLTDILQLLASQPALARPLMAPLSEVYLPDGVPSPGPAANPFTLPFTEGVRLPDPLLWLAENASSSRISKARCTVNHRLLRTARIIVDEHGDGWLANINRAGHHHSLYDLITLAVDLLLDPALSTAGNLRMCYELGLALAAPRQPEEDIRPTRPLLQHASAHKALAVLTGLRDRARLQGRYSDERELQWGLLLEIVRRFGYMRPEQPAASHARLLAAVLCARLEAGEAAEWPPRSWPTVAWVEPATYQRDTVKQIFDSIRMAESRIVVGLPGMSQTRLLLQLVRRVDVQQHYLRERAATTMVVSVDCNRLAGNPDQSLYELLLTALCESCARRGALRDLHIELHQLRRETIASGSTLLAQRNLEHAIALLCYDAELSLCFVLDKFDTPYRRLSAQTLSTLCALHDQHSGQFCYILGLSEDPRRIRRSTDGDEFNALFARPDLEQPPDGKKEAQQLIEQLAARTERRPPSETIDQFIALSGCHPRLVTALFLAALDDGLAGDEDWMSWATTLRSVQTECAAIWRELPRDERQALRAFVLHSDISPFSVPLQHLQHKGILRKSDRATQIFSPLFSAYIGEQQDLLWMDQARRFWRGAAPIKIMQLQRKLLTYLYEHPGQICDRSELLDAVYGKDEAENRDPQDDVDTLVRRVRERIEPESGKPHYLLSRPPGGYQLVGTEDDPTFDAA